MISECDASERVRLHVFSGDVLKIAEEIFRYLSLTNKEFPEASKMFERPIMDREYFGMLTDSFRSPHLWFHENGEWKLRRSVFSES